MNGEYNHKKPYQKEYRGKTYHPKARQLPCRIRYKILSRDRYRCVLCGSSPANDPTVKLHIDHIIPLSKGGKCEEENLQTLCMECNLGKGDD